MLIFKSSQNCKVAKPTFGNNFTIKSSQIDYKSCNNDNTNGSKENFRGSVLPEKTISIFQFIFQLINLVGAKVESLKLVLNSRIELFIGVLITRTEFGLLTAVIVNLKNKVLFVTQLEKMYF